MDLTCECFPAFRAGDEGILTAPNGWNDQVDGPIRRCNYVRIEALVHGYNTGVTEYKQFQRTSPRPKQGLETLQL